VVVRPEGIELAAAGAGAGVRAIVVERRDLGPLHLIWLQPPGGPVVKVRRSVPIAVEPGQEVEVRLDPAHAFVYASRGKG
jgi:hypothetical protein